MSALRSDADYNIAPMRTTTFSKMYFLYKNDFTQKMCSKKAPSAPCRK